MFFTTHPAPNIIASGVILNPNIFALKNIFDIGTVFHLYYYLYQSDGNVHTCFMHYIQIIYTDIYMYTIYNV